MPGDLALDVDESKNSESDSLPHLDWNQQTEGILSKWLYHSRIYCILHQKSYKFFKRRNYYFNVPIIILSTLTGMSNLAISSILPLQYNTLAQVCIGSLNMVVSVLSTLLTYFQYPSLEARHQQAFLAYGRMALELSTELRLERHKRSDCRTLLKQTKIELEKLMEQSPLIRKRIIKTFKSEYTLEEDVELPDNIVQYIDTNVVTNIDLSSSRVFSPRF